MAEAIFYENVWENFQKLSDAAVCHHCKKTISCKGSTTTGLHRHLEGQHKMKRKVKDETSSSAQKRRKEGNIKSFMYFTKNESVERIVAELAAKDGISIFTISNSRFIRESIQRKGYSLPQNPSHIMDLINKFYATVKTDLITKITNTKKQAKKFSLSIDEWTSAANRRFLNIHLYCNNGDSYNLGLIRMEGSFPAEKILEALILKLKEFNLSLEDDIVSITSDGASVMTKLAKLSPVFQQLCYNHGIHLAVIKTFYKNSAQDHIDININSSDEDTCDECECDDNESLEFSNANEYCAGAADTIKKIRKIVKTFKKSPVRNSILQKYIKETEKTEMQLLLDCKTRWSTMEMMLERFLKLEDAIFKALDDLNFTHLWITENEHATAVNMLKCLQPVKKAIEALSRKDATLLSAEGVLKFLFKTLQRNNTQISRRLLEGLEVEIAKRRDVVLLSLVCFLQNPENLSRNEELEFFQPCVKTEIMKKAKSLLKRLFFARENEIQEEFNVMEDFEEASNVPENCNYSLDKELEECIQKCFNTTSTKISNDRYSSLSKEIQVYEATGKLTSNLNQLKEALNVVKPTSTQNERNFSISGYFVNKRRTRMGDESLDHLCFLKDFFLNENCITDSFHTS